MGLSSLADFCELDYVLDDVLMILHFRESVAEDMVSIGVVNTTVYNLRSCNVHCFALLLKLCISCRLQY